MSCTHSAGTARTPPSRKRPCRLLDHVLEDGFIDYETGFITGYRETTTNQFCLNYQHKNNWFCPGSMAKIAYQLLIFSDLVDGPRKAKMQSVAVKTADWIHRNVRPTANGWYPRRCHPNGEHYPQNAYGDGDILFEKSGDGLFIIQLNTALTQRGLADYSDAVRRSVKVFMDAGGLFGSINHDTYDEHESVAYSVAFRTLRQAAKLLKDDNVRAFAYDKCLAGLDQFKMTEDRNGVQTKGLLYMEKSWDTAYLWENAEAALAYFEAYEDTAQRAVQAGRPDHPAGHRQASPAGHGIPHRGRGLEQPRRQAAPFRRGRIRGHQVHRAPPEQSAHRRADAAGRSVGHHRRRE